MEGRMRVALISTQRGWRGGEAQALLLLEGLRQRGCECLLLARRGSDLADRGQAARLATATFAGNGRGVRGLLEIRRQLARFAPDVLHANDSHAVTAGGLAGLGLRIPVRVASRRVDFPIRSAWKYRPFDQVLCVSRAIADVCRASGLPSSQLAVVRSGVDPRRIASGDRRRGRAALGLTPSDTLLLNVAALADHKGHADLLRALPAVIARCPRLVVAIAGEGDREVSLRSLASELGVAQHVRWLGFRDDIPDLLRAADLFAFPSRQEGLGTSVIDAMLAECPIVATTAGGIPELLVPGPPTPEQPTPERLISGPPAPADPPGGPVTPRSGQLSEPSKALAWCVPPARPEALAEAIWECLSQPAEARRRAVRARRRAQQEFSVASTVQETLQIYRQLRREAGLRWGASRQSRSIAVPGKPARDALPAPQPHPGGLSAAGGWRL